MIKIITFSCFINFNLHNFNLPLSILPFLLNKNFFGTATWVRATDKGAAYKLSENSKYEK